MHIRRVLYRNKLRVVPHQAELPSTASPSSILLPSFISLHLLCLIFYRWSLNVKASLTVLSKSLPLNLPHCAVSSFARLFTNTERNWWRDSNKSPGLWTRTQLNRVWTNFNFFVFPLKFCLQASPGPSFVPSPFPCHHQSGLAARHYVILRLYNWWLCHVIWSWLPDLPRVHAKGSEEGFGRDSGTFP